MSTKTCTPCDTGHYCLDGKRIQCDNHHYQDQTQQTACKWCTYTGDEHGIAPYCPQVKLLKWCDTTDIGSQNQVLSNNCKPCSNCLFGSELDNPSNYQGKTHCYDA